MKLVLLGKPMSGKGTQARMLTKELNLSHISTGDLLREEVKKNSGLGKEAKEYMNKGVLVPDELIIRMLEKNLPEDYILDGFPRTIKQAEALDKVSKLDLVIDIDCSDKIIVKRTVMRQMCRKCGAIYGLDIKPVTEDQCDSCDGELYKRDDDNEETIKKRLEVYNNQTAPLINYYKDKGIYVEVNGEEPIANIKKNILSKIESVK
ncbi:MAG: adenylate kinase [Nanoarchaeota archaeon]|nr:adenylate kinase [Nanoarchaeota archaeon]